MKRFLGICTLLGLLAVRVSGQGCMVSLGNDTSLCGGGVVNLSIATQFVFFEDSLRIRYDASQGQSGLVGASKVYMHSGAEMVPFGGWQYPVGNWGMDDGVGQMRNVGGNLWEITIHPQSYYGYPVGGTPNGILMVFRNENGSQTGKDNNGNDIFLGLAGGNPSSPFSGVTGWWKTDAVASILWSDGSTGVGTQATSTGAWWVQVTDTGGCVAADTVNIGISNGPTVNLGPNQVICPGQVATLNAGSGFNSYVWNTGATTQTISVATTGNYYVTVTDGAGCEGLDLVYVLAQVFPTAAFSYSGVGQNYAFVSTSQNANSQAWDFDGNGVIDATSASPGYTYANPGTYTCRLIVENECGGDTTEQLIVVGTVAIDPDFQHQVQLFPNPFHSILSIESPSDLLGTEYVVLGLDGRVVAKGKLTQHRENLEMEFLARGSYILKLSIQNDQQLHYLLVKE